MKTFQRIAFFLLLSAAYAAAAARRYDDIQLSGGAVGPESIAFDCHGGGPYVGVSDGRILKWRPSLKNSPVDYPNWTEFAHTSPNWTRKCRESLDDKQEAHCGRPLGLKFHKMTCQLYIADAYFGLMVVGHRGGRARTLSKSVNGSPFKEFLSIYSTNDSTGRLMKYNLRTKTTKLLLNNLPFANGVALSKNRHFVLITETSAGKVRRFWLKGPNSGRTDVFIQLEALPDNINANEHGDFWIAQYPPEMFFLPRFHGSGDKGLPVKVSEEGKVLVVLDDTSANNTITTSDVMEFKGRLWFGSLVDSFIEVANH
ncbi:hypothetical protein V2J09_012158 [Rumex salicifolius]